MGRKQYNNLNHVAMTEVTVLRQRQCQYNHQMTGSYTQRTAQLSGPLVRLMAYTPFCCPPAQA